MELTKKMVFGLAMSGSLLASSCVREDMSECASTNKLLLSYTGDGTTEIFPEKIDQVEMYVFDASNRCVSAGTLPQDQVESRTVLLPPLDAGEYRIVCVGNAHATEIRGVDGGDYSAMTFAAADYVAGKTVSTNDSLYYASLRYPVGGYGEDQVRTIAFASSHYDLLVEVLGIPDAASAGSGKALARASAVPTLRVCGVAPSTDFENCVCGEATDYVMEARYDAADGRMTAFANIMRHENHEAVDLCLIGAGGAELARINFAEFLAAHPSIDCSKQEIVIPIRIEFKSGKVDVSLPDWYVEGIEPEF